MGNNCPALAGDPLEFCRETGTYDCYGAPGSIDPIWGTDVVYCGGAYNRLENIGKVCGTTSYACVVNQATSISECKYLPDVFTVINSATGRSCSSICSNDYANRRCESVGYDKDAGAVIGGTNNIAAVTGAAKSGGAECSTQAATCSSVMAAGGLACTYGNSTYQTSWTWCRCTSCDARLNTNCPNNPAYDSECYYSGKYDCDGNCINIGVINTGGVCYNNTSGLEGRCLATGLCQTCHTDYLNNVPCSSNPCVVQTRQCDGTCATGSTLKTIGESCGTNMECDANGNCVAASTLPNIAVPNIATNRSCLDICDDFPTRYCVSVGLGSDPITGGTGNQANYFGLVDNVPSCVPLAANCTTIIQRSPSSTADPNYGFTCDSKLTNWTYCRCSNL
jgi:hypothetical protein